MFVPKMPTDQRDMFIGIGVRPSLQKSLRRRTTRLCTKSALVQLPSNVSTASTHINSFRADISPTARQALVLGLGGRSASPVGLSAGGNGDSWAARHST